MYIFLIKLSRSRCIVHTHARSEVKKLFCHVQKPKALVVVMF